MPLQIRCIHYFRVDSLAHISVLSENKHCSYYTSSDLTGQTSFGRSSLSNILQNFRLTPTWPYHLALINLKYSRNSDSICVPPGRAIDIIEYTIAPIDIHTLSIIRLPFAAIAFLTINRT